MKNFVDNLIVTFDEIEDTAKRASVKSSNGINYWLINHDFHVAADHYC